MLKCYSIQLYFSMNLVRFSLFDVHPFNSIVEADAFVHLLKRLNKAANREFDAIVFKLVAIHVLRETIQIVNGFDCERENESKKTKNKETFV